MSTEKTQNTSKVSKSDEEWRAELDPDAFSEIEVLFTLEGDATRVTLEHRHLDRHTAAEALRDAVGAEGGWPGLLQRYSEAVG